MAKNINKKTPKKNKVGPDIRVGQKITENKQPKHKTARTKKTEKK